MTSSPMRACDLIVLVACACGSPQPAPSVPPPAHTPSAPLCPPAYGSTDICTPADPRRIVEKRRTDVGQGPGPVEDVAGFEWPRCMYPQGSCACQQEGSTTCHGGAALPPAPAQPPPFRWECTPAVRDDGCPGVPPHAGEPCTLAR